MIRRFKKIRVVKNGTTKGEDKFGKETQISQAITPITQDRQGAVPVSHGELMRQPRE